MQKEIVAQPAAATRAPDGNGLDLESIARVRLTSEDPAHPIESALHDGPGDGWRASSPGPQTLSFQFEPPQAVREIYLRFESAEPRTQEFVLLWSNDAGTSYRELVRQQFNFSSGTGIEEETYFPQLENVTHLKLTIIPDISGGAARASLRSLRIR